MIINNQYLNQTNTSYLRERRTATNCEKCTITKNLTGELAVYANLQASNKVTRAKGAYALILANLLHPSRTHNDINKSCPAYGAKQKEKCRSAGQ
ncbi:hypothetical protein [Pseudomonas fulva]|uniref:hypothetical protein n=1 Tax=Pseudomonas fulva TaxID=47880 RepID=UPI0018DC71D8|nr:hypothetical protein [Pseudomonas fulva]